MSSQENEWNANLEFELKEKKQNNLEDLFSQGWNVKAGYCFLLVINLG